MTARTLYRIVCGAAAVILIGLSFPLVGLAMTIGHTVFMWIFLACSFVSGMIGFWYIHQAIVGPKDTPCS